MKLFSITLNRWMALIALSCIGMLAFGLYLQHVVGLNPCPMCIVQRYAMVIIAVIASCMAGVYSSGLSARFPTPGLRNHGR